MSSLVCDIVTPQARLFSEDAYMVVVPAAKGYMGYCEGHLPLLSVLSDGIVRVKKDAEGSSERRFVLKDGYVEVTGKKVIVLADRALPIEDIQSDEVQKTLADFENALDEAAEDKALGITIKTEIEWCKLQLAAVKK